VTDDRQNRQTDHVIKNVAIRETASARAIPLESVDGLSVKFVKKLGTSVHVKYCILLFPSMGFSMQGVRADHHTVA